jgi:hypothetical protein
VNHLILTLPSTLKNNKWTKSQPLLPWTSHLRENPCLPSWRAIRIPKTCF